MKKCARESCENEVIAEDKRTKYCSKSCSNIGVVRNKKNPDNFCSICGKRKSKAVEFCRPCKNKLWRATVTIKDISYLNTHPAYKFNGVRKLARETMETHKEIEKTCPLCQHNDFDEVVEVCHIKDIASFPEETLVKEVNDIDNLIYLCPSHHALFDRGLINLR